MPEPSRMNKTHSKTFIISQVTKTGNIRTSCLPPNYIFFLRIFHEQTHTHDCFFNLCWISPLINDLLRWEKHYHFTRVPCGSDSVALIGGVGCSGAGAWPLSSVTAHHTRAGLGSPRTLIRVCQRDWGHNSTPGLSLPHRPATALRPQRPQPGQIQSLQSAGRRSLSVHHWVRSCLGIHQLLTQLQHVWGWAPLQCPLSRVSLCPPESEHWTQPSATCAPTVFKPSLLGREDPLEKKVATHSSILVWEIAWTEAPGRLQSMGSQKSRTWLSN